MTTGERSTAAISTDQFKDLFRSYLGDLQGSGKDQYGADLISRLFWCLDRWNDHRQRFFPETDRPMRFPFILSPRGGRELSSFSTVNSFGAPSTINVRRDALFAEKDINLTTIQPNPVVGHQRKLVLKDEGGAGRDLFVSQLIVHELIRQYLHEGANEARSAAYAETESGKKNYRGHGPIFVEQSNQIGQQIHQELGLDHVPVRHSKRTHAPAEDRRRPTCSQWGWVDLLFCWDPTLKDLSAEEAQANEDRLQAGLKLYQGAIELVDVDDQEETDFKVPYSDDAANTCLESLFAYDQKHGSDLVKTFAIAVASHADSILAGERPASRRQLQEQEYDDMMQGHRDARPHIHVGDIVLTADFGKHVKAKVLEHIRGDQKADDFTIKVETIESIPGCQHQIGSVHTVQWKIGKGLLDLLSPAPDSNGNATSKQPTSSTVPPASMDEMLKRLEQSVPTEQDTPVSNGNATSKQPTSSTVPDDGFKGWMRSQFSGEQDTPVSNENSHTATVPATPMADWDVVARDDFSRGYLDHWRRLLSPLRPLLPWVHCWEISSGGGFAHGRFHVSPWDKGIDVSPSISVDLSPSIGVDPMERGAVFQRLDLVGVGRELTLHQKADGSMEWDGDRTLPWAPVAEQMVDLLRQSIPTEQDTPVSNGNGHGDQPTISTVYPVDNPTSLDRLLADIEAAGGGGKLAKDRYGLKDGSTISRHKRVLANRWGQG